MVEAKEPERSRNAKINKNERYTSILINSLLVLYTPSLWSNSALILH